MKGIAPELKEEELLRSVEPILQEYLEHGDSGEVVVSTACKHSNSDNR